MTTESTAIQQAIHSLFKLLDTKRSTIATAESCTGGLLGSLLTTEAGSSKFYHGSIVAYANDIKQKLLGVPEQILAAHGAVSKETAEAMVCGLHKAIDTTYGISITGIAGPDGGTKAKPVGTIYCGFRTPTEVTVKHYELKGTRQQIREEICLLVLHQLILYIEQE